MAYRESLFLRGEDILLDRKEKERNINVRMMSLDMYWNLWSLTEHKQSLPAFFHIRNWMQA